MPKTAKSIAAAIAVIGIDIGKNVFHLIGLDKHGRIALKTKLTRGQLDAQLANMQPCLIGMEACNGAHHLSRKLIRLGHDARLMPANYVKAFLKGNKNDFRDAEAIAEAVQRPTMRFVATKTEDQLDLQALHRIRARLVRERTAVINEIRAFLLERGIAVAQGWQRLRKALPDILATREDALSLRMRHTIEDLADEWRHLDKRIEGVSIVIQALAEDEGPCDRLMTMPGVAHIISTATVAAIGDGRTFERGRAILPPGSASCHGRYRPATAPSSAKSRSAGTAICARFTAKRRVSCCFGRRPGNAMV